MTDRVGGGDLKTYITYRSKSTSHWQIPPVLVEVNAPIEGDLRKGLDKERNIVIKGQKNLRFDLYASSDGSF